MSENPYVPPSADLGDGSERTMSQGTGEFEVGRCVSEAWAATWANFPTWLGVGIVALLALILAAMTVIGIVLVIPVLTWGYVYYLLRAYDGNARFADLFAGFSGYGAALVSMLGCIVLVTLISLLWQSVQLYGQFAENDTVLIIGALINLVAGVTIAPRVGLAYFYVVDRGCGPIEAIGQAWTDTAPLQLQIVLLVLTSYAVAFAGLLALGIGVIPAIMVIYLMWVSAYRQYGGAPVPS